jgi:hypothetical protein
MIMAALPLPPGLTRVLATVVMHLPLLLVVLLSAPALIVCPFLPETWCASGHALLCNLRSWHRDILDRLSQVPSNSVTAEGESTTLPNDQPSGSMS